MASATATISPQELETCIQDAIEICEIPSPTNHEGQCAEYMAKRFTDLGLEVTTDEVGNVIASIGEGPCLAVVAHMDTVFPDSWDIKVKRHGNKLSGPGISDNCLGLAGLLFLARQFADKPIDKRLMLVASVGEEAQGDLRGVKNLHKNHQIEEFIALEGSVYQRLMTVAIGFLKYRLTIKAPEGKSTFKETTNLLTYLKNRAPSHIFDTSRIKRRSDGRQQVRVDFVDINAHKLQQSQKLLEKAIERFDHLEIELSPRGDRPGGRVNTNHPLVRQAVESYKEQGVRVKFGQAISDANIAHSLGIPAISMGLAEAKGVHSLSESADVSMLDSTLSALYTLVTKRLS